MRSETFVARLSLLSTAFFCPIVSAAGFDPWAFGIDARIAFAREESTQRSRLYREGDGIPLSLAISLPISNMVSARLTAERRELSGDRGSSSSNGGFNPTYEETRMATKAELVVHRPRQTGLHPYISVGLIQEDQEVVVRELEVSGNVITPIRATGFNDANGVSFGAGLVWLESDQEYTLALQRRALHGDNDHDGDESIIHISAGWHVTTQVAVTIDLEQHRYEGINNNEDLDLQSLGLQIRWRF